MSPIPRDKGLDNTPALLRDGYLFISKRCRLHQSDIFATRLMLQPVTCMLGEEAARVFYHPGRFTRRRAIPLPALTLLQDKGSVAMLDGEAHHRRKRMFMSLMTPDALLRLGDSFEEQWHARLPAWEGMDRVVLLHEAQGVLCRAVCAWAGIPLTEPDAEARTREFDAMVEGAGAVGPRNWRGQLLRARTERWARYLITNIRGGAVPAPEGSAAQVIARHEDAPGALLDPAVAAVELINVLRPTVAVAWYVIFAALALHDHPESRDYLLGGDEQLEFFVQEVRRFYPFFPLVGGRAMTGLEWRGHHFAPGAWVLLDLYGTNHDPRAWQEPEAFRPERFRHWDRSPFNFIPQGGGDFHDGHRCAGEWATLELLKRAAHLLTTAMRYEVPTQDLEIRLSRMPALPNSRFVIGKVKATS